MRSLFGKPRPIIRCQTQHNFSAQGGRGDSSRLRLLSFNIQAGISTSAYHHYLTRSWKHLLPHQERYQNLEKIGLLLQNYDLVAIQEADGGSLRSSKINQVQQLAQLANFPFWYQQLNRNFGPFAQHSNGLLSRIPAQQIQDHPLPGPSGRGAIIMQIGTGADAIAVVMMHLALGNKVRNMQLDYVCERVQDFKHFVLMGDLNARPDELMLRSPLKRLNLHTSASAATFPSWKPQRCLDHILLSPALRVANSCVLPIAISDHLPVATELILPAELQPQFDCLEP